MWKKFKKNLPSLAVLLIFAAVYIVPFYYSSDRYKIAKTWKELQVSLVLDDAYTYGPENGGAPVKLIVLFHGSGGTAQDILALAEVLSPYFPDAVFVAPNGPLTDGPNDYKWYAMLEKNAAKADVSGVYRTGKAATNFVETQRKRYGLRPADVGVLGFSQGGTIALEVAMNYPGKLGGAISVAGLLFLERRGEREWPDVSTIAVGYDFEPVPDFQTPVLLVHGTADQVINVRHHYNAAEALEKQGRSVTAVVIEGLDHQMDRRVLDYSFSFLKQALYP